MTFLELETAYFIAVVSEHPPYQGFQDMTVRAEEILIYLSPHPIHPIESWYSRTGVLSERIQCVPPLSSDLSRNPEEKPGQQRPVRALVGLGDCHGDCNRSQFGISQT